MIQRWKIHGNQLSAVTEPVLEYVLYTDHLAALAEKDKKIEQLEAENYNMRKIFDGLMAILPPENDETKDPAYATHVATHGRVLWKSLWRTPAHR